MAREEAGGGIRILPDDVVNRVAAGEVLQRPSSALKELVENALDASASRITLSVKDGGNKLLTVQDDGRGISSDDLPLLCARHATSKLRSFEELPRASTRSFGFRGEALASMSFAGRVTVTSMRPCDPHALYCSFRNGVPESNPSPCAGVPGTIISVEDIFVTMPARRRALRPAPEEYSSILSTLQRYACLHYSVAFTARKHGGSRADLNLHPASSRLERIQALHGPSLTRELIHFNIPDNSDESHNKSDNSNNNNNSKEEFKCEALVSKCSCENKRSTFSFFVNGRPVSCAPLRKAVEAAYTSTIPKQVKPFAMLFLSLPPEHVDVNVHPTKEEVHFMHQEEIGDCVHQSIQRRLLETNTTRTFNHRRLTTSAPEAPPAAVPPPSERQHHRKADSIGGRKHQRSSENEGASNGTGEVQEKDMDRSDPKARKLDAFFTQYDRRSEDANGAADRNRADMGSSPSGNRRHSCGWSEPELASVDDLLAEAEERSHSGLNEVLSEHTFVGMADGTFALMQHRTKLYLASLPVLTQELMRQQAIRGLGQFRCMRLSEKVPLRDAIRMALDDAEAAGERNEQEDGPLDETAEKFARSLFQRKELLSDCFSLDIDEEGNLRSMPVLVEQYQPPIDRIPELLLSIACDVDWSQEKVCFSCIAAKLGDAYAVGPLEAFDFRNAATLDGNEAGTASGEKAESMGEYHCESNEWLLKHVIFPAMSDYLYPPQSFAVDGHVMQVACLERLYKIFERC